MRTEGSVVSRRPDLYRTIEGEKAKITENLLEGRNWGKRVAFSQKSNGQKRN